MLHPEMYIAVLFIDLYKSFREKYCITDILATAMDAGYITPYICKALFDDNILPTLLYKILMTKDVFSKSNKKNFNK